MEFQILSGQYSATASTKADEDDEFEEVLEKAASKKGQDKVLTKDSATDAAIELMESKNKANTMDDMEHVKTVFSEIWKEHDIQGRGFIDYNEGFSMMQDLVKKMN